MSGFKEYPKRTNRNTILRESLRDKPINVRLPALKIDQQVVASLRKAIEKFLDEPFQTAVQRKGRSTLAEK
jgi:hypothetical protein